MQSCIFADIAIKNALCHEITVISVVICTIMLRHAKILLVIIDILKPSAFTMSHSKSFGLANIPVNN